MADLIVFPVARAKRQRRETAFVEAEIVIFTGVRIERRGGETELPKTKPRPTRRQQAVKLKED
jgi:hypothetical protein